MVSLKTSSYSIVLVAVGLLIAFVIVEATTRLLAPDWLKARMDMIRAEDMSFDGSDEYFPVIRVNGKIKNAVPNSHFKLNHYEYSNSIHTDEYGGRVTHNKGQDELAVFLGDSITFGIGVKDQETFVNLLSENSEKYRYINLGMPGSMITNQLDVIEMKHKELNNPKLYIFTVFMGNDLIDIYNYYSMTNDNGKANKNDNITISLYDFLRQFNQLINGNILINKCYSLQLVRQKLLNIIYTGNNKLMDPVFMISFKENQYLPLAIKYYEKNLARLIQLSQELKFDFIFILIPDMYQIDFKQMSSKAAYYNINPDDLDLEAPNKALHKILNAHKIRYIDTTDCLKKNNKTDKLYYIYDTHLTNYGHQSATKCIEESSYGTEIIK